MYLHVVPEERSSFARHGLTYWSPDAVEPGVLVEIPLRSRTTTGIVLGVTEVKPTGDMDIKQIVGTKSVRPILLPYQLKTLFWLCEYYCCSPRHALQLFLPSPSWAALGDEKETLYTLLSHPPVRGRKQQAVLQYLLENGEVREAELREKTGASGEVLTRLLSKGLVRKREDVVADMASSATYDRLLCQALPTGRQAPDLEQSEKIFDEPRPTLLVDSSSAESRFAVFCDLACVSWNRGKSSLLLFPSIVQATETHARISALLPEARVLLAHSGITESERRRIVRQSRHQCPLIIVGTRTALFLPIKHLGLLVLDQEHERMWKSEQTPKYHARLTSELLAKHAGAKLVLASPTPSLDSLRHALPQCDGSKTRYALHERGSSSASRGDVRVLDLTEADFGTIYPFTTPLLQEMQSRLERREVSLLLLNRRGTGSSLLCFECRRPVTSPETDLPLSVITRGEKQWLLDRFHGDMCEAPALCPACGSASLRVLGAGTERVEEIVRERFLGARIVRVDADTLDHPRAMSGILTALDDGKIDIILGTQSVLAALPSHRVTLAAILVADIGLSVPDFRAGERVFQLLTTVLRSMEGRGAVIVQTFRPEAPEIKLPLLGQGLQYLRDELRLREEALYPPAVQLIDLIVRNDRAKAMQLLERLRHIALAQECSVSVREDRTHASFLWIIRIRGKKARELLRRIPLAGIVVDVDPVE